MRSPLFCSLGVPCVLNFGVPPRSLVDCQCEAEALGYVLVVLFFGRFPVFVLAFSASTRLGKVCAGGLLFSWLMGGVAPGATLDPYACLPVSYTHLTLPTIYSV